MMGALDNSTHSPQQNNEMRRNQSQVCAVPTDHHEPGLSESHDTTTEPLLDPENENTGPDGLIMDNDRLHLARSANTLAESLSHQEKQARTLPDWPIFPKSVKTPTYISVLNGICEVLLLASSVAFLAFALMVSIHDQDSIAEHPRLTKTLVNATKYVLLFYLKLVGSY
jgi:hypothetical protein